MSCLCNAGALGGAGAWTNAVLVVVVINAEGLSVSFSTTRFVSGAWLAGWRTIAIAVALATTGGLGDAVTTVQESHKHSPTSPFFQELLLQFVMYSEKNLSPLSLGSHSARGNGISKPTRFARLLTYHNSE